MDYTGIPDRIKRIRYENRQRNNVILYLEQDNPTTAFISVANNHIEVDASLLKIAIVSAIEAQTAELQRLEEAHQALEKFASSFL